MKLLSPRFKCKGCGKTGQHNIEEKSIGTVKGSDLVALNTDDKITCRKCRKVTIVSGEIPVEQK